MLDKKLTDLINEQIAKEFYSAYLYLHMANHCENEGLDGFANWYTIQAQEERDHAMIFRNYLINNGVRVVLEQIDKPTVDAKNISEVLAAGLGHEKFITASIDNIYGEAFAIKDFKSMQFLDWFVKEQVEEEKNASDLITKYELFGSDSKGLYMLNQELGGRTYTPTAMLKA